MALTQREIMTAPVNGLKQILHLFFKEPWGNHLVDWVSVMPDLYMLDYGMT